MNRIDKAAALELLKTSDLLDLGEMADAVRKELHPGGAVTFVVDRNINYTNVCINKCAFCAFYREAGSPDAYVLSREALSRKIDETLALGGTQILLQGGLHPDLDMEYYIELLQYIKDRYTINVHGFSPPEITYLAEKHNLTIRETLMTLKLAGLDSIPGGGAELLSDRVREVLSPKKIKSSQWLKVMEEAHRIGMRTTATMMFGSIEGPEDIMEHLDAIRNLQDRTGGFTAFIPWTFQPGNTELLRKKRTIEPATAVDYLRILALSRIYLDNFNNIQASWVTQGLKLAQLALRFGANDFGSTMIEENVVKAAGVSYRVSKEDIIQAIQHAGFKAAQRDTYYRLVRLF
ncbi:MAG TPA: cyclic dehypoxanthinyl futalosine synthase [Dissulfurispiraceae bacterium]|nr:cyclic dehypoxanthinyl futalosine synthase [Dissulfurispiraceae bacterium]